MDCWHDEIDKAATQEHVLRAANDYLALWAPRELGLFGIGLGDLRIQNADDIERVKRWLTEDWLDSTSEDSRKHLKELAGYFWHAASRLGELEVEATMAPAFAAATASASARAAAQRSASR